MPNPIKSHVIDTVDPAGLPIAVGGAPQAMQMFRKNFYVGDMGVVGFMLRVFGNLNLDTSSAGTIRALGGLDAILSLTLKTDKHSAPFVDSVDGRGIVRMLTQFLLKQPIIATDIAAATTGTPTFEYNLAIPMAIADGQGDKGAARNFDTLLDVLKATPELSVQCGDPANFIAGGTYTTETIQALHEELREDYVDPLQEPSIVRDAAGVAQGVTPHELPLYQLCLEMLRFQSPTSTGKQLLDFPYGDRIYLMIGLSERDDDAPFDEVSNMTVANTDKIAVKVGGVQRLEPTPIKSIRAENARRFNLTAMPTGWTVLDFRRSGRIVDGLNVLDDTNVKKTVRVEYECTGTVSDRQIFGYMLSLKPLSRGALRDVQIANPGVTLGYVPASK